MLMLPCLKPVKVEAREPRVAVEAGGRRRAVRVDALKGGVLELVEQQRLEGVTDEGDPLDPSDPVRDVVLVQKVA